MNKKYEKLFEPYTLNNGVKVKNRLVVAPLTIYDSGKDGELTEDARNFWNNRFEGFGMFIMPFTNVHPGGIGFESPNAFDERHLDNLKEYADIAHKQGALSIVQIAHAGLRANSAMTQGHKISVASKIFLGDFHVMTEKEVYELVENFSYAAELALLAGHDGVEIHGANGWLVQQFVSAATNLRNDYWGGTFIKRLVVGQKQI